MVYQKMTVLILVHTSMISIAVLLTTYPLSRSFKMWHFDSIVLSNVDNSRGLISCPIYILVKCKTSLLIDVSPLV